MAVPDREELAPLVKAGLSDQEIADRFGVTSRTALRWRQRLRLPSMWTPPVAPHGTESRYKHQRCRCTPCRAAHADVIARENRDRNMRSQPDAVRSWEPWTAAEDAIVLAHVPTEAAPLLSRSWRACRTRRDKLRRAQEVRPAA